MRRVLITVLGSALFAAAVGPAFAAPPELLPNRGSPSRGQQLGQSRAGPGTSLAGRGRGAGFGGIQGRGDRFRNADRGGYRDRGYGGAVGAGVAGLAAGALIGGALANRDYGDDDAPYGYGYGYPAPAYAAPGYGAPAYAEDDDAPSADQSAYCAQRYRSYDPQSGTYLGFDGERHPCP